MPVIGGVLINRLGNRFCVVMYASLLSIGMGIVAIGGWKQSFSTMIVGRVIYGIGSESMYVSQICLLTEWFRNFEFSVAMGVAAAVPCCFSVLGGTTYPAVYSKSNSLGQAYFIGFLSCCISLIHGIGMAVLDRKAERADKKWLKQYIKIQLDKVANKARSSVLRSGTYILEGENFNFEDLKHFSLGYWFVAMSCMFIYVSVVNAIGFAPGMLQERFNFDET